jgi:Cys-tRNA(Pro)/Cys-tRNA(Cys) deacylase
MVKNNVIRLLESRHVNYTVFELSAEKHGAMETAQILQTDSYLVYKTIVVCRDRPGKPILAVVPGPSEVDLKKLAMILDEKKLHLPTEKEAESITGSQAGGISPLALINKGFRIILDAASQKYDQIHISGGQRGLNIKLPVKDLISLTNAKVADISSW